MPTNQAEEFCLRTFSARVVVVVVVVNRLQPSSNGPRGGGETVIISREYKPSRESIGTPSRKSNGEASHSRAKLAHVGHLFLLLVCLLEVSQSLADGDKGVGELGCSGSFSCASWTERVTAAVWQLEGSWAAGRHWFVWACVLYPNLF